MTHIQTLCYHGEQNITAACLRRQHYVNTLCRNAFNLLAEDLTVIAIIYVSSGSLNKEIFLYRWNLMDK